MLTLNKATPIYRFVEQELQDVVGGFIIHTPESVGARVFEGLLEATLLPRSTYTTGAYKDRVLGGDAVLLMSYRKGWRWKRGMVVTWDRREADLFHAGRMLGLWK